jgi:hypothetical protein
MSGLDGLGWPTSDDKPEAGGDCPSAPCSPLRWTDAVKSEGQVPWEIGYSGKNKVAWIYYHNPCEIRVKRRKADVSFTCNQPNLAKKIAAAVYAVL